MPRKIENAQPAALVSPPVVKIDFDAWWAMNEKKIPAHHHKEVILADFRARGLSLRESIQSYNDGLKRYGLKIK